MRILVPGGSERSPVRSIRSVHFRAPAPGGAEADFTDLLRIVGVLESLDLADDHRVHSGYTAVQERWQRVPGPRGRAGTPGPSPHCSAPDCRALGSHGRRLSVRSSSTVPIELTAWSAHRASRVAPGTSRKNQLIGQPDRIFPGPTLAPPDVPTTKVGRLVPAESPTLPAGQRRQET